MSIKITKRDKQELFGREKIAFHIEHEKQPTPSRNQIRELLRNELGTDFFVITSINSKFGFGVSSGEARVYKSEDDMKSFEPEHLIKRDFKQEKKEEVSEENKEAVKGGEEKEGE